MDRKDPPSLGAGGEEDEFDYELDKYMQDGMNIDHADLEPSRKDYIDALQHSDLFMDEYFLEDEEEAGEREVGELGEESEEEYPESEDSEGEYPEPEGSEEEYLEPEEFSQESDNYYDDEEDNGGDDYNDNIGNNGKLYKQYRNEYDESYEEDELIKYKAALLNDDSFVESTELLDQANTGALLQSLQSIIPEVFSTNHQPDMTETARQPSTTSALNEKPLEILPSANVSSTKPKSIRMTDLGYKISQMVLMQHKSDPTTKDSDLTAGKEKIAQGPTASVVDEDGPDLLLERHLQGRRRNRPGTRGRPKREDYGFGDKSKSQHYPPEVAKLMGRANQAYVSREYNIAIPLLLEVVRHVSDSFEPYHTLGLIYEELGIKDKSFSYYLIAAHLCKKDIDLWHQTGQLALQLGRTRDAVYCLSRLIKLSPQEDLFWIRARLWLELGEYRNAVLGFVHLLRLKPTDLNLIQKVARLALGFRLGGALSKSLEGIFFRIGGELTWSHLNILLELLIAEDLFAAVNVAIEKYSPIIASTSLASSTDWLAIEQEERIKRAINILPLEIKSKRAIAFIRQGLSFLIDPGVLSRQLNDKVYPDLRLVVGMAYFASNMWTEALTMFLPLLDNSEYGTVEMCLKIGKCYAQLGQNEAALDTLSAANQFDPSNLKVKLALKGLYSVLGRLDMAKAIELTPEEEAEHQQQGSKPTDNLVIESNDPVDIIEELFGYRPVLIDPSKLGWEDGTLQAEPSTANISLLNIPAPKLRLKPPHLRKRRHKRPKPIVYTAPQCKEMKSSFERVMQLYTDHLMEQKLATRETLMEFCKLAGPLIEDMTGNAYLRIEEKGIKLSQSAISNIGATHGLTVEEWFVLFRVTIIVQFRLGDYDRAMRLVRLFLTRSVFALDINYSLRLRLIQIGLAIVAKRFNIAQAISRWFLRIWPDRQVSLLLYHGILRPGMEGKVVFDNSNNSKFILRLAKKLPPNPALICLAGHVHLVSGAFDEAIREYRNLLRTLILIKNTTEPALDSAVALAISTAAFYLAIAYIHSAFRRTCQDQKAQIITALGLLRNYYFDEKNPETIFNTARALHGAGLVDLAANYYNQILDMNLPSQFTYDAAYNLHLIYMASGSSQLAHHILYTFCKI